MAIAERILRFIRAEEGALDVRPLIACSGGPDSTALAHAWMVLAATGQVGRPTLVYIDHGLRPDSGADGARVAELAAAYGGDYQCQAVVVDDQASLEDAARRARYQALESLAVASGDAPVLLGHTASDQAETVLMRILRGTGVHGLRGMAARRGRYYRPLLRTSRTDVLAYLSAHGLSASDDPMNADARFFRSRVRHQLLPALRGENPALDAALLRLAASAAEIDESLRFAAEALLEKASVDATTLDVRVLSEAPPGLCKHAFSMWAAASGLGPLSARHLTAVGQLVAATAGTQELDLPGGTVIRSYEQVRIARSAGESTPPTLLQISGPEAPYQVRSWQPGDRMRPLRLQGRSKKLSDLYGAFRVPRHSREQARVVVRESDGEIVWAEHIGLASDSEVQVSLTQAQPVATNGEG